ncbi:hypothetical protein O181_007811 [Austropuccinia psidii MF-1]|uniref:Ca3427-like PBP 2 domain-containing protein n=1 Tax=Austropuccinia psidii MF-1 TaxID=1389203 RepID=A0A9Q3BNN3_9BASI|nr:hypothetical protein [Austropuccinia psidii MF-1]
MPGWLDVGTDAGISIGARPTDLRRLIPNMSKLRIGYVPEHFSTPLLQLFENDSALSQVAELVPNPSGTGQMIAALKDRTIHLAIALTESLIAGIITGKGDYKLIGTYVTSPLNWAVITGAKAEYASISDLKGGKIGISRPGSGSQVMAAVMALQQGWLSEHNRQDSAIEFVVNDSFKNLRDSVNDGSTAAFMWEWFTTKPYQDSGEVKFIGNVPTPWSSWMIAASPQEVAPELLSPANLKTFLEKLDQAVHRFGHELGIRSDDNVKYVQEKFEQKEEDVKEWMKGVSYPKTVHEISRKTIEETVKVLGLANVIQQPSKVQIPNQLINLEVAKVTP